MHLSVNGKAVIVDLVEVYDIRWWNESIMYYWLKDYSLTTLEHYILFLNFVSGSQDSCERVSIWQ